MSSRVRRAHTTLLTVLGALTLTVALTSCDPRDSDRPRQPGGEIVLVEPVAKDGVNVADRVLVRFAQGQQAWYRIDPFTPCVVGSRYPDCAERNKGEDDA